MIYSSQVDSCAGKEPYGTAKEVGKRNKEGGVVYRLQLRAWFGDFQNQEEEEEERENKRRRVRTVEVYGARNS